MSVVDGFRIDGRVAVVTGAARGIGAACADALEGAGATVVRVDVLESPVKLQSIRTALNYTLQLGSFTQMDNARQLRDRAQWIALKPLDTVLGLLENPGINRVGKMNG